MYHFKAKNETDLEAERLNLVWQMLTAQLESSHQKLMGQYGMEVARAAPVAEDSLLRGPRKGFAIPPAPMQLPAPGRDTGPGGGD